YCTSRFLGPRVGRNNVYHWRKGFYVHGFKAFKLNGSRKSVSLIHLINSEITKVVLVKLSGVCYVIIFAKAFTLKGLTRKLSQVKFDVLEETCFPNIGLSLRRIPLKIEHASLNISRNKNCLLVIEKASSGTFYEKQLAKASLFSIAPGFVRIHQISAHDLVDMRTINRIIYLMTRPIKQRKRLETIQIGKRVGKGALRNVQISLKPHVGIFGTTGMGKTTLLALIARELCNVNCKVLFISMSDNLPLLTNFKYLVAGVHFSINPLNSMTTERALEILEEGSVAMYGDTGRFSPMVRAILEEVLRKCSRRDLESVIRELNNKLAREYREDVKRGIEAVLRRLHHLYCPAFKVNHDICRLLIENNRIGISLSSIGSIIGKCVFVLTMLNRILDYWNDNMPQLYVIIDEVHRLVSSNHFREPILEVMMREGRNKNITLIIANQTLHDLHNTIRANITTYFFFRLPNPVDSNIAASIVEVGDLKVRNRIASLIQKLPLATCIFYQDGTWELIRVRQLKVQKFRHNPREIAFKHGADYIKLYS
ncbi:MAG TPA: DUF87 domain-containing protein, partial [Thermoproteales archaeon]|nr:DUF87 domain-containing protein [Thermoproteales archaeon]